MLAIISFDLWKITFSGIFDNIGDNDIRLYDDDLWIFLTGFALLSFVQVPIVIENCNIM